MSLESRTGQVWSSTSAKVPSLRFALLHRRHVLANKTVCTIWITISIVAVHESTPTSQGLAGKKLPRASVLGLGWICSGQVNTFRDITCLHQGRAQHLPTSHYFIQFPLQQELLLGLLTPSCGSHCQHQWCSDTSWA